MNPLDETTGDRQDKREALESLRLLCLALLKFQVEKHPEKADMPVTVSLGKYIRLTVGTILMAAEHECEDPKCKLVDAAVIEAFGAAVQISELLGVTEDLTETSLKINLNEVAH